MPLRRWQTFAGVTFVIIITLIVVGITFTIGWRPFIGAKRRALTERKFEATPQRLARGKYLVDGVMGCFGCHTDADRRLFMSSRRASQPHLHPRSMGSRC